MTAQIQRLRERAGDSEKITINLGYVDLGHIDLLVQESFYSNRTASFAPRSGTSSRHIARRSSNPSCGTRSSSVSGITRARIWRP